MHGLVEATPEIGLAVEECQSLLGERVVLPPRPSVALPPVGHEEARVGKATEHGIQGAPLDLAEPALFQQLRELVPVTLTTAEDGKDAEIEQAAKPQRAPVGLGHV